MPTYDTLLSADIIADYPAGPDQVLEVLTSRLGIIAQSPSAIQDLPEYGTRAIWVRLHRSLSVAPTRIEILSVSRSEESPPFMRDRLNAQDKRQVKTHATILTTSDIGGAVAHFEEAGVPYCITPRSDAFPFERVWIGTATEEPGSYDPSYDAGLMIEIIPTATAGYPRQGFAAQGASEHFQPGDICRVVARSFIVEDLADAMNVLHANLGLIATSAPTEIEGGRVARYGFAVDVSAELELIECTSPTSPLGKYMDLWGPGAYSIRMGVWDMQSYEARLEGLGTNYTRCHPKGSRYSEVLRIDETETYGVLFEVVDLKTT